MEAELSQSFTSQAAPVLVPSVILLAVIYFSTQYFGNGNKQKATAKLPHLGNTAAEYMKDARQLLRKGYHKYSNFRVTTTKGQTVVLSKEHMIELLKRPEEVPLEFELPVQFDFQPKYTGIKTYNPITAHLIREVLTPGIPRFVPRIAKEVEHILEERFPQGSEWGDIKVFKAVGEVVAIAAGAILIGHDLCYKSEWVDTGLQYTWAVVQGATQLKQWPWYLRPFVYRTLPDMKEIRKHENSMKTLLVPEIKRRREVEKKVGPEKWAEQKPDDYIQWYMDTAPDFGQNDDDVWFGMLGVAMVSMNSTTNACTQAVYDLASHPEYQVPLRQELQEALAKNNGTLSKDALFKCHKLDSFLKESQRTSPEVLIFGKRILLTDFYLSDGTFLPKGTYVCVPIDAVTHDPANYPDPEKFDGYRHSRQRAVGGFAGEKHQWISSNKTALNFGYGKHSCPGRFFATTEIKLIFAFILLHYDVKLRDGETRPKTNPHGDFQGPNPNGIVQMKKRVAA